MLRHLSKINLAMYVLANMNKYKKRLYTKAK